MMQSSPPPNASLVTAMSCPWCNCPASPSRAPQTCQGCRRRFTLTAGPAQDPSVVAPPPHPHAFPLHLKWSIVVTYKFARLDPGGVSSGTLDPVVAMAPIDQVGIAWPDVVSIAVWRKLGWVDCVIAALIPLPLTLLMLWATLATLLNYAFGVAAICGVITIVFGLLTAYLVRRGAVIGIRQARIAGRYGTMTIPFSPMPAFHFELFRRSGLIPPPIP